MIFPLSVSTKNKLKAAFALTVLAGATLALFFALGGAPLAFVSTLASSSWSEFLLIGLFAHKVNFIRKFAKTIHRSQKIENFEGIDLHRLKDEVAQQLGISKESVQIGVDRNMDVKSYSVGAFYKGGIVISLGLLRYAKLRALETGTNPETYIKDVIYHEMGHIQHWDSFKNIILESLTMLFVASLGKLTNLVKIYQISNSLLQHCITLVQWSRLAISSLFKVIISGSMAKSADEVTFKYEGKEGALRMLDTTINNTCKVVDIEKGEEENKVESLSEFVDEVFDNLEGVFFGFGAHPQYAERVAHINALEEERLQALPKPS